MENETNAIPRHLGIIMDGNRRWAKEHGLPTLEGHRRAFEIVKKIIEVINERGISIVTFYCFSTENWNRSKMEVDYLMDMLDKALKEYFNKYGNRNIRIRVIGQKQRLSPILQEQIAKVEQATEKNTGMTVNLAISYGGRTEIVEAIKSIIRKDINPNTITEQTVKENLWTPDVDLIIRTGREQRISNFLIWQAAYSEFLFVPKFWPEFTEADLDATLKDFANRKRRFGK